MCDLIASAHIFHNFPKFPIAATFVVSKAANLRFYSNSPSSFIYSQDCLEYNVSKILDLAASNGSFISF